MRGACAARLRRAAAALSLALLAACGHAPTRPPARDDGSFPHIARGVVRAAPVPRVNAVASDPCAPTRVHDERDYTPGGLYAPGVADSGPAGAIDVSGLREPVPRREPLARTGNRSPYTVLGKVYRVRESAAGYHERGLASWYGTKFNGRATSSGELYDICRFTAAHKTLPLPSYVRVTNLDNGRSLIVRVNDRGPFHDGRVMDLSYAAAVRLGVDRTGTAHVDLEGIDVDGDVIHRPATEPSLGGAVIQVASFSDENNARRLAQRLVDAGFAGVDLDQADAGGRPVWRVRIGRLTGEDAEPILDRLRGMGLSNARVLHR